MTVLPPALAGSVARYAVIATGGAVVSQGTRWDKRMKEVHRMTIADAGGIRRATVPVCHATPGMSWSEVRVSSHGDWQPKLRAMLDTCYSRTPYYLFCIDTLWQHIPVGEPLPLITDLDRALECAICALLQIPAPRYTDERLPLTPLSDINVPPYWQVRYGTAAPYEGLSILDLLFNLGPEATLLLDTLKPML